MKIKSLAKGLLIMLISVSVLLSLTFSAYAQYNGGGGGNNDGKTIGGGGVYEADQGYRISLVNTDGSVYGGKVVNIELKQKNGGSLYDNASQFGSATASDQSSKGQDIKGGNPYENVIEAPKAMVWEGSKFVGNGNAVKAHMLQEDSNGDQNILAYAKQFLGLDDATIDVIKSGQLKIELEPIYNFPIYNSNGQYTGDRFVGSAREFIEDYVRTTGYNNYNQIAPALRGAVQAMILEDGDLGLEAMDPSELEKIIDSIIVSGDFSKLGLGLHIFNLGDTTPPSPPPTPTTSTGNLDITESRITRHKKLSEVNNILSSHSFKWDVPAFTIEQCNYSHHKSQKISDKTNVVNIDEKEKPEEDKGVIGESKYWSFMGATLYSGFEKTWSDRQWGEQNFLFDGAEYSITVIKKNDRLNLIDYNNRNGVAAGVIQNATSFVDSGNISNNRAANGSGVFNVSLRFEPDTGVYKWTGNEYDDETTAKHTDCYDYFIDKRLQHDPDPREETIQTNFDTSTKLEMNLAVNWSVYAGIQNSTKNDTTAAGFTQIFKNGKQETWLELNYGTVTFVPYIKMQFDTPTTKSEQVYVAGQYQRSFTANEHVGVIFNTSKNTGHSIVNTNFGSVKGKISLQSNQWSTHASAIGSNRVLPGGAVLDLAILKDDRQTFTVESIKPILVGSGSKQVNATGSSSLPKDEKQAVQEHNDFVKQVVNALEGLSVQQYIVSTLSNPKSITKDVWSMSGAKAVSPTTQDSKYYFRPDSDSDTDPKKNGKSNAGDIDVNVGKTETVYYTFFSNTAGDIRCKTGTSLSETSTINNPDSEGTVILSKGQTGITDKTIYNINEKTHIVDNLRKAIERNTGSDSDAAWVSDGHWYNEAFDGITIIYQKTTLSLGTINPYVRSAVLDPELCPSSISKSDLFTKYVASQFKMRDYSEVYGYGKVGKLADYRGYEFTTQKLDQLFISDIFYIPNVTVQDLR